MTGDEMERAIAFILRNQADFDSRYAAERLETDRKIRDLATAQGHTQKQLDHLSDVVSALAERQQRNRDDIDALVKLVGGPVEGRNGGAAGG